MHARSYSSPIYLHVYSCTESTETENVTLPNIIQPYQLKKNIPQIEEDEEDDDDDDGLLFMDSDEEEDDG